MPRNIKQQPAPKGCNPVKGGFTTATGPKIKEKRQTCPFCYSVLTRCTDTDDGGCWRCVSLVCKTCNPSFGGKCEDCFLYSVAPLYCPPKQPSVSPRCPKCNKDMSQCTWKNDEGYFCTALTCNKCRPKSGGLCSLCVYREDALQRRGPVFC
jgi:hypothetical protein